MKFLRSKLFTVIVSVLVFTGYSCDVLDYCCENESQVQADHTQSHSGKKAPEQQKDDGKCICWQIFSGPEVQPVCVAPRVLTCTDFVCDVDEVPPDVMPLGIEYPPQIA